MHPRNNAGGLEAGSTHRGSTVTRTCAVQGSTGGVTEEDPADEGVLADPAGLARRPVQGGEGRADVLALGDLRLRIPDTAARLLQPSPTFPLNRVEGPAPPEPQPPAGDASDHHATTGLLDAELPDPRFVDDAYLRWLYDQNPVRAGFHESVDEDGLRMAHFAMSPQEYRNADGPARMVFSLNAVTRSGVQRKGWFTTLGERLFERAAAWGALGVIGVSNENSTPPVVRKLDYRLLGPLPVRVVPAVGPAARSVQSVQVDPAYLDSPPFAEVAAGVDEHPALMWTNRWTPAMLRWRLSAPNMASPYWVHSTPDLVAVTARERVKGVPVAVVLKLLPRARGAAPGVLDAGPLVVAACRFHRAPFAVYAGFNRHVRLRGLRPPRRVLPAPLNLIYRSLSDQAPKETFALDTFEFLDMDAY